MARLWLACACCVGVIGCGSDVIDHSLDPEQSSTATLAPESFGEDSTMTTSGSEGSNFPEPALTRCGGLDGSTDAIVGLHAAYGVVAIGGATDEDGAIEPGTIRLRLTDGALFDCVDQPAEPSWLVALTLSPAEAVLGSHELAELFDPQLELVEDFERRPAVLDATLVLSLVTQDCLVGELTDVAIDGMPAPELEGAFAAELCGRTCLPTATHAC